MLTPRIMGALLCAMALACASAGLAAEPTVSKVDTAVETKGRYGVVRLQIDPAVGDQEAEIRQLLAAHSFVRIEEPADFLVTTPADFPLDLVLVDLRQPRQHWRDLDADFQYKVPEPRQHAIGNLRGEGTSERLGRLLVAASRLRAILDRSIKDTQGVDTCLIVRTPAEQESNSGECYPLEGRGARNFAYRFEAGGLQVRNRSTGERYVSVITADGSFRIGSLGKTDEPAVWKLAPGGALQFQSTHAAIRNSDDPRVMLLVSSQPFTIDELSQPSPLQPTAECAAEPSAQECEPKLSGVALNDDLAVRSFQLIIPPEIPPAIGQGTDATAQMAVWMAQFYSVLPYTAAEIAADAKLPKEESQLLRWRSYEERQHRCGATLIAPDVVLTAAHCVAKEKFAGAGLSQLFKDRRVRLGTRKLGKGGQSYQVAGVAVHAEYDPDQHNHDLALLLLRPDRGSGSLRQEPIAVADRPLPGGVNALAFGWGFTGAVAPNGNIMLTMDARMQSNPDVLQYGEMTSVTLDQCRRKLANRVAKGMLCMYSKAALEGGRSADGVFTCRGDSGGPLVRKVRGRDVLVGVVGWSMGCGYKNYPSVSTDVGSYAQWIAAARAALKPGLAIRVPAPPARIESAR